MMKFFSGEHFLTKIFLWQGEIPNGIKARNTSAYLASTSHNPGESNSLSIERRFRGKTGIFILAGIANYVCPEILDVLLDI